MITCSKYNKYIVTIAQLRKIMQNQWDSSHHPYCKYQIEIFLYYPKLTILLCLFFVWLRKNSAIILIFCLKHVFRSAFRMLTSRSYPRHLVQFCEREKSILPPYNLKITNVALVTMSQGFPRVTFYTVDHIIWLVDLTIKCIDLICRSIDLNYRLQLVSRSY